MIQAAVFDNSIENRSILKQTIIRYTVNRNIDFDVLWFFEDFSTEKIKKFTSMLNIALISADLDTECQISRAVYESNEDCRIIYYSSSVKDLEPMLCVRTRGFHLTGKGEAALTQIFDDIIEELKDSTNNFYYSSRREIFVIPMRSIIYFQSDLKYVIINIKGKNPERIYSKLTDIEPLLNSSFLRIHKSYIVNINYVSKVDKSNKTIILKNGETLPISDINYKTVINYFSEREIHRI